MLRHSLADVMLSLVPYIVKQSSSDRSLLMSWLLEQEEIRWSWLIRHLHLLETAGVDCHKQVIAVDPRATSLACSYLNNYKCLKFDTSTIGLQSSRAFGWAIEKSKQPEWPCGVVFCAARLVSRVQSPVLSTSYNSNKHITRMILSLELQP